MAAPQWLGITSLVVGIIVIILAGLSAFGVFLPWVVTVIGTIAAVVLGAFLIYWGVQTTRGVSDPWKQAKTDAKNQYDLLKKSASSG